MTDPTHWCPDLEMFVTPVEDAEGNTGHPNAVPVTQQQIDDYKVDLSTRELRARRNYLLDVTDKITIADRPVDPVEKEAWLAYRQELRDLPANTDPLDPDWPVPPGPLEDLIYG